MSSDVAEIYDSSRTRAPMVEELLQLRKYNDLLKLLVAKNIKTRYKRSFLGVLWTLLNPLLQMLVLTIAFSQLFRYSIPNYPVYLLSGLILWTFLAQTTTASVNAVVWGSALLRRVYLPPSLFPLSSIGTGLVNLLLSMAPLLLIMMVIGHPFSTAMLFLPVPVLLTSAFALGISLLLSTTAVVFTDIVDMYEVVLRAWFFLTPIMYPEEIFPASFHWVLQLNPAYHLILTWRQPIFEGHLPEAYHLALATLWSASILLAGWWFFCKRAHEFAYRA